MRILKYILLLLLLFSIGLFVFIATQKGDYNITRTKIIKSSRTVIYNYVNDYKNWESFADWSVGDKKIDYSYPAITSGIGSSYSWNGLFDDGSIKTISVKQSESITQKLIDNGTENNVVWTFKDTLGKTKVTWKCKGKMDVSTKLKMFLNGGIESSLGDIYEKTLINLDKTLDYELNTYNIKVNGIVVRPGTYFVGKRINSRSAKVAKNIAILLPQMIEYFEKNNMVLHGKPYILYHKTDLENDIVTFSVCAPIKDSVYFSPGSNFYAGKTETYEAVKLTLTGDRSHIQKTRDSALGYIFKNKIKQDYKIGRSEIYVKTVKNVKNPSKWVTEFYYPILKKPIFIRPRISNRRDSSSVSPPSVETNTNIDVPPIETP